MVQTLSGSWWLWLVPLFIVSLLIMIPASLNELGIKRAGKQEKNLPEPPAGPIIEDPLSAGGEDDLLQVVLMAAAAYMETENRHGGSSVKVSTGPAQKEKGAKNRPCKSAFLQG